MTRIKEFEIQSESERHFIVKVWRMLTLCHYVNLTSDMLPNKTKGGQQDVNIIDFNAGEIQN